jgi:mannose-6-phosphate isomerase-like protein (cupin superfamily)
MSGNDTAIKIVEGDAFPIQAPNSPADYMRAPFTIGTAINMETDTRIEAIEDEEEARRRYLATREGVNAGKMIIGPGGGEAWHTHLTYYDTVLFVRRGSVELKWRVDDGPEQTKVAREGDFVFIPPVATHQWLNTGDEELEIVWFMHFHNYEDSASA